MQALGDTARRVPAIFDSHPIEIFSQKIFINLCNYVKIYFYISPLKMPHRAYKNNH